MKNLTKEVEERLSEEGIVSLTKEYGSLDFVPSKLYSEEECISLIRSVSKILYGNDDRQSLYKVGKIIGKMHLKGQIAKTIVRFIGNRLFRGVFLNLPLITIFKSGIKNFTPNLDVVIENPTTDTLVFTFSDTLMPKEVFEGEWHEAYRLVFGEAYTQSKQLSVKKFQIIICKLPFKNHDRKVVNEVQSLSLKKIVDRYQKY